VAVITDSYSTDQEEIDTSCGQFPEDSGDIQFSQRAAAPPVPLGT
jgi:hypothetical protein